MKIGFLVCVDNEIEKTQMFGIRYMPVWVFTLAAYLREIKEIELFLYDTRFEDKSKTPLADIYLISGVNQDIDSIIKYNKLLKQMYPNAIQIIGGPITLSYNLIGNLSLLNGFDHLFIGDGENLIKELVSSLIVGRKLPKIIHNNDKFPLKNALAMDYDLLKSHQFNYYGGVVEVSRGCPFLCEFCDIRTKPNNNIANNKSVRIIIQELDQFLSLGVKNILFACDNFIGDVVWAELVCDEIILWKQKTGHNPSFYTWLTINISFHPKLLEKLRLAGFDMFFIGVESFGRNQLLETAKLQNVKTDIKDMIMTIQTYGFIIVAGLIFGFDTDPEDAVQITLDGIRKSGLISGDPSLLTALPGTPLYRRIEKSGRLRKSKIGLGGKKYATNILYLRKKDDMIKDFIYFVKEFNSPDFQYSRFESFVNNLMSSKKTVSVSGGYIDVKKLWKMLNKSPRSIFSICLRFFGVINSPKKIFFIIKAFLKVNSNTHASMTHFYFWLFNWSNSILKYGNLKKEDFDIDWVGANYNMANIIPNDYHSDYFEPIPTNKIKAQRNATIRALENKINNAN